MGNHRRVSQTCRAIVLAALGGQIFSQIFSEIFTADVG